jgi:hypothetical protein
MANSPKTKLGSASVKQPVAGKSPVPSTPKSPTLPSPKKTSEPKEAYEVILQNMQRDGIPLTREHYMARAYGDPNYKPWPEEQDDLPPVFRDPEFR